jgi:TfoX/Sxy family transcriptional regulator of competence genes
MAYDEALANRVRSELDGAAGLTERKMFGGLAFLVHGHMACGLVGDELMVRVGADAYDEALAQPEARAMDFTGRPMRGMVMVSAAGVASRRDLARWVARGARFVATLPPK